MRLIKKTIFALYRRAFLISFSIKVRTVGINHAAEQLYKFPPLLLVSLLRKYGAAVEDDVSFKAGLHLQNISGDISSTNDFSNLSILGDCFIGQDVFIDLTDRVFLERQVVLSSGSKLITHADCGGRAMSKFYPRKRAPIRIGAGSWIGSNAMLLPGVTLGSMCVVAAGAVVLESFPSGSVVAGVPAKLVKTLRLA